MPFNYEALEELRGILHLNKSEFVRDINRFFKESELELTLSRNEYYQWIRRKNETRPAMMDALHRYSRSKGQYHLAFYIPPPYDSKD